MAKKKRSNQKSIYADFLKYEAKDEVRKLQRKANRISKKAENDFLGSKDYSYLANERQKVNSEILHLKQKYGLKTRRSSVQVKAEKRSGKFKGEYREYSFFDIKALKKDVAKAVDKGKKINGINPKGDVLKAYAPMDEAISDLDSQSVIVLQENNDELFITIRKMSDTEIDEFKDMQPIRQAQRKAYYEKKAIRESEKSIYKQLQQLDKLDRKIKKKK